MTKKLWIALASLVAALAIAPAAFGQVCADCDGGGGGGGGGTGNTPPTAAFSVTTVAPHTLQDVAFASSSNDPDGSITGYQWDFGDGGSSTSSAPTHQYASGGTYTVTLTVTDNSGATGSISHDVGIANQAPTADFTLPSVGFPGQPVSFTGQANDPEGHLASYSWNFGDNGMADVLSPEHTYAQPGTYDVTFKVYDDKNAWSTLVKKSIRINAAPTAHITTVTEGVAGSVTQFMSQNSDSDGSIASSCWDFGDGHQTCGGGGPGYAYPTPGTYTAKLTVTDNDGSTGTDSVVVHIAPAPVTGDGGSTPGTQPQPQQQQQQDQQQTPPPATDSGQPATPPAVADKTAPALVVPKTLKAKKKSGKLSYSVSVDEAANVVAKLSGKVAGGAKLTITKAGKRTIVIKLSSSAKKALAAARVVKLTLTTTATDAAGNKTTKVTKVSLV